MSCFQLSRHQFYLNDKRFPVLFFGYKQTVALTPYLIQKFYYTHTHNMFVVDWYNGIVVCVHVCVWGGGGCHSLSNNCSLCMHMHACMLTHMHAKTHAHKHAHTHTCIHAHTPSLITDKKMMLFGEIFCSKLFIIYYI